MTIDRLLALRCADAALASYTAAPTIQTDDVHALVLETEDLVLVALKGTDPRRLVDLWRDAGAIDERNDPLLGRVPETFAGDAEQLFWRLWPLLPVGKPFALTGHSKGASEAQLLAAMLLLAGHPPAFLAAFEPAAVGDLHGLLTGLPGLATRHGHDPVTFVPPLRAHAQPLLEIPWDGPAPLDPLAYHDMQGVRDALRCMTF